MLTARLGGVPQTARGGRHGQAWSGARSRPESGTDAMAALRQRPTGIPRQARQDRNRRKNGRKWCSLQSYTEDTQGQTALQAKQDTKEPGRGNFCQEGGREATNDQDNAMESNGEIGLAVSGRPDVK